jgi:hypothetical protein
MRICTTLQWALYSSCDSLVNYDGTLTDEGDRALTCIKNGALLAAGAGLSSMQLELIIWNLLLEDCRFLKDQQDAVVL